MQVAEIPPFLMESTYEQQQPGEPLAPPRRLRNDSYLGAVGRGLVKLILAGTAWAGAITAYAMLMVTYEEGFDTGEPGSVGDAAITGPGPVLWAALIVMALTGLVTVIWWIVDGVGMSRRLERLDAQLRQELSREHGVDPWAF